MRLSEQDYATLILGKGKHPVECRDGKTRYYSDDSYGGKGQRVITLTNPKPSKYRSVMEECQGIKFQSKKEARYFRELQARMQMGEVKYFLRQVPFDLFGVKYRVDFMEVLKDGRIRYVDVKGFRTPSYKAKRKQVMNLYPVVIEEA